MTQELKKQFVRDCLPKAAVETTFVIKYVQVQESRDGRHYLNIIFGDKTGSIEGRVWNNAKSIGEGLKKGDFVKVSGKVNLYLGRRQLVVRTIDVVTEGISEKDYIPSSSRDATKMYEELQSIVKELDDYYIRELLTLVLSDEDIKMRLLLWPAAKSIHHAYQSGLLEHILSCTQLGLSLSDHYKTNKNYIVAGAILHDLCKIYELTSGANVEYTDEGKLVGHLVMAFEIIDRFSYRIKKFPFQTKIHLKHIIASHHGEYEYGSPKIPQTKEALLVHLVDYLDSKMNAVDSICKNDTNVGKWSGFIKHMDRIFYKEELPKHTEPIPNNPPPKRSTESAPKQSMGKLLEGIKIKDS